MTALDSATPLAGRYAILREIGRGGMATVFLATDLVHKREVAVKLLHPALSETLGMERFQREVSLTAALSHPNLLPLYDAGEWDGRLFYVMPFIEGESLRERLKRERQLAVRDALAITRAIAAALEYAHSHGVVHRDIKPENILLSSGQPVLCDLGIARTIGDESERLTATGVSIGSPAYMSPEQASGERDVDARSDLYSLGCVLYEMLAGEPPFTGPTAQAVMAKRLAAPAPDVRVLRDSVSPEVAAILDGLLSRAPADRLPTAAALMRAIDDLPVDGTHPTAARQGKTSRASVWSRRSTWAVAAGLLVVAGVAAAMPRVRALWPGGAGTTAPSIRTLAVLPLSDMSAGNGGMSGGMGGMSGQQSQDGLADGVTDALITGLSQLGSVNVISRMSASMAAMQKKPLRDIAAGLHADGVIQGSVTRVGSRVRISARLIRASDERLLWTQSYDRDYGDALALESDVAGAVAQAIGARVAGGTISRPVAVKREAQEAYLKGMYFAGQWRLDEATKAFQSAVAIDPRHAAAYAALARAYYFQAFFGEIAPAEAFSQVRRAATRALEQQPDLAEAYGLLALVATHYDWDWVGAEKYFARALALNPNDAQVHHDYAHHLLAVGREAQSVAETRRALELDPANPMLTSCVGWHSLFDKRYGDARRYAMESQRMMPSFWASVVTGWSYLGEGRADSAVAAMRSSVKLSDGLPFTQAALAHALARQGQQVEARKILDGLLRQSLRGYVPAYDVAIVYAGLGERDHAFEWLHKAMGERSMFLVHLMWDTRLDDLRLDPRFADIVTRMGMTRQADGVPRT